MSDWISEPVRPVKAFLLPLVITVSLDWRTSMDVESCLLENSFLLTYIYVLKEVSIFMHELWTAHIFAVPDQHQHLIFGAEYHQTQMSS